MHSIPDGTRVIMATDIGHYSGRMATVCFPAWDRRTYVVRIDGLPFCLNFHETHFRVVGPDLSPLPAFAFDDRGELIQL